jgi:hypothetical protein
MFFLNRIPLSTLTELVLKEFIAKPASLKLGKGEPSTNSPLS